MRLFVVPVIAAVWLPAAGARAEDASGASRPTTPQSGKSAAPNTAGVKRPDPELTRDLRYGHVFASVSGGVWLPTSSLAPTGRGFAAPDVGGDVRVRVGFGLNGHLVGFAEGGLAHASGGVACAACSATSVAAAIGVSAHLSQGLAVNPWISLATGYRGTFLNVDDVVGAVSDAPVHGIEFARIAMGFDHAPIPWFGFGPFVATNVGARSFDGAIYADVVLGLSMTFDPRAASTRLAVDGTR